MRNVVIILLAVISCKTLKKKPVLDQASLQNFIIQSPTIPGLDSILNKAAGDSFIFRQTAAYLEKPLSDPNSKFRNEDLYIKLLQEKLRSPWYIDAEKTVFQSKITLAQQNRPGNAANDLTYITANGSKFRLYDIAADHTLLFFYNPECEACKEYKAALIASPVITQKVNSGELAILAVYTDRDTVLWKKHLPEMPRVWLQGRDENEYLYKNKIYDLKAIPTIYLLDKNKKVLLKDCQDIEIIEQNLANVK